MSTHLRDLYAQRLTCMRNLMFWNALQNIESNKNRVLPEDVAVYENKSDELITHVINETKIQQKPCWYVIG